MRVNTDPRTWITLPRPAQGPKFGFATPLAPSAQILLSSRLKETLGP